MNNLYALRRKDTGEFFKSVSKNPWNLIPKGDPRLQQWTKDLSKAKFYSLSGVKVLAGSERKSIPELEIVKVEVVVKEVITV